MFFTIDFFLTTNNNNLEEIRKRKLENPLSGNQPSKNSFSQKLKLMCLAPSTPLSCLIFYFFN